MLQLQATFPNCWDGRRLDSADHKQHMKYASRGLCPASHPVAMPQIILIVLYPPVPLGSQVASGRFGAHADFMNGWDQAELERLVAERDFLAGSYRPRDVPADALEPPDAPAGGRAGRAARPLPRPRRRRARPLPAPRSARPRATNARRDAARPAPPSSGRRPLVRRQGDRLPGSRDVHRDVRARVVVARRRRGRRGIPAERTVLGGFSQGAVMTYALGLGAGRPRPAGLDRAVGVHADGARLRARPRSPRFRASRSGTARSTR